MSRETQAPERQKSYAKLSELTGISQEELQSRIEDLLPDTKDAEEIDVSDDLKITLDGKVETEGCLKEKFSVSLPVNALGITGNAKLCGSSGSHWTAKLKVNLEVFGKTVFSDSFKASPSDTHVCRDINLTAVKADICYGIRGRKHCAFIKGSVCIWKWNWKCYKFDKNISCF